MKKLLLVLFLTIPVFSHDNDSNVYNTVILTNSFFLTTAEYPGNLGTAIPSVTAEEVRVFAFTLANNYTITKLAYFQIVAGAAGTKGSLGIYSVSGALIVSVNAFALDTGAGAKSQTIASTTLRTETYYLAVSASTTANAWRLQGALIGGNIMNMLNLNGNRFGTAENPSVAGVMPATLGTVTDSVFDGNIITIAGE